MLCLLGDKVGKWQSKGSLVIKDLYKLPGYRVFSTFHESGVPNDLIGSKAQKAVLSPVIQCVKA